MWAWRCGNCTRAVNPAVAERILACVDKNVRRLRRAASSVARNGAGADMLVSPGNVAGVVSNVVEKALGGLKKAGNAPFQDVLDYGCPPRGPGLYLMDGPGHARRFPRCAGAQDYGQSHAVQKHGRQSGFRCRKTVQRRAAPEGPGPRSF